MSEDNELFELCKEVYERTGLGHPITDFERGIVIHWEDGQMFDFPTDELDIEEYIAPLYTSDYLLEKLQPFKTEAKGNRGDMMPVNAFVFVRGESKNEFRAGYRYNLNGAKYSDGIYADTPLKALLKLTIALSEAGELK